MENRYDLTAAGSFNKELLPAFERKQYEHLRASVRNWPESEGDITPTSVRDWIECYPPAAYWAYALDIRAVIKAARNEDEAMSFITRTELQFADSLFRMED